MFLHGCFCTGVSEREKEGDYGGGKKINHPNYARNIGTLTFLRGVKVFFVRVFCTGRGVKTIKILLHDVELHHKTF